MILAPLLATSFGGVLGTVAGVLLALTGLCLAFMGLAGVLEGALRRGAAGLLCGLAFLATGLWLCGFLG